MTGVVTPNVVTLGTGVVLITVISQSAKTASKIRAARESQKNAPSCVAHLISATGRPQQQQQQQQRNIAEKVKSYE